MGLFNLAKLHAMKIAMPMNDDVDEDFDKYRRGTYTPQQAKPFVTTPKVPKFFPDISGEDDLRSVKWTPTEIAAHMREQPQFQSGNDLEVPQKAIAQEKAIKSNIKNWVAAQYDVDHGLAATNPFPIDTHWFDDERPPESRLSRNPIALFWDAAKTALTTPYAYPKSNIGGEDQTEKNEPIARMTRRPDVESYITGLVTNGKRQAVINAPLKQKEVGPVGGMAAAHDIKDRYPYMDTFLRVLSRNIENKYRAMSGRTQNKNFGGVEEGIQNGLLTSFSETSTGKRNDLRFFAGEGWQFIEPAIRQAISAQFVKEMAASNPASTPAINLDDPSVRAGIIKQFGPMFSAALDEWTPALHQRLEALFRMSADPIALRGTQKSGLRMAPDVEKMDSNAQVAFIEKFRKAAIKYAISNIDMRTNTVEKAIYNKKKKEQAATGESVGETGETFDTTEQQQAADQRNSDAVVDKAQAGQVPSSQIDSINEVKQEIRQAVLPVISRQLLGIADDLEKIGDLVSRAMRVQQKGADIPGDEATGKKFERGRRVKFAREYSALFKLYADFVARELRTAANDANGHKLLPILLSVANQQGLLGHVPEMSKKLRQSNMLEFRDRSKEPSIKPKQTLGTINDPTHGVPAVQSHSVLGTIWNMSKPEEDKDYLDTHLGRLSIPGRSDLARRLNMGLIIRSPKFTEMVRSGRAIPVTGRKGPPEASETFPTQRTTWPHIPAWNIDPSRPETSLDQRSRFRAKTKSKMLTPAELDELRDKLPQLFTWWSNFLIMPEVMQSTSAIARQVFMDSLPVRDAYKAGLGNDGKNVYKYYYAGIYGLQNAPAFYDTKNAKQVPMTPVEAAQYIHKCQQEARDKNRTFRNKKLSQSISREVHLLELANRMSKFASADRTIVDHLLADVRQMSAMLLEW